jgi:hypothetical protein
MPLAVIAVMLIMLVPHLRRGGGRLPAIEPPTSMHTYRTGSDSLDAFLHEGMRRFNEGNYEGAARLLAKSHFYISVKVREGEMKEFPRDLRFFLGLAYCYRGDTETGIPLIEAEAADAPGDERYPWHLAHCYLEAGERDKAIAALGRVAAIGGSRADEALEALHTLE